MKSAILFVAVLALAGAAIYWGERQKPQAPVSAAPVTHVIGDTERELTRVPMHLTRLSDDEEIEIGNQIAERAKSEYGTASSINDFKMEAYVREVGRSVAAHAHRKLPYQFHYIPNPGFVNAFALPGGHIFMGAGLVRLMDSEDQLAAILGHEIEHVDHYHCIERFQIEARTRSIPLASLATIPLDLVMMGYSKEQELEADREGLRLAVMASYSPNGVIRMFESMDRLYHEEASSADNPASEMAHVALGSLTEYFRSHPPTRERITQLRNLIASEHWKNLAERDLQIVPDRKV